MSPLAKEVIEKLSHEEDEPSNKEIKLVEEYKNSKEKLVSFDDLVRAFVKPSGFTCRIQDK